mgnify:CR=1 FL=1
MNIFLGNSASNGIGIGTAFVIPEQKKRTIPFKTISEDEKDTQWERFNKSLQKVISNITVKMEEVKEDKVQSEIFGTYFLMLNDPEFIKSVKNSFEQNNYNIEWESSDEKGTGIFNGDIGILEENKRDILIELK